MHQLPARRILGSRKDASSIVLRFRSSSHCTENSLESWAASAEMRPCRTLGNRRGPRVDGNGISLQRQSDDFKCFWGNLGRAEVDNDGDGYLGQATRATVIMLVMHTGSSQ